MTMKNLSQPLLFVKQTLRNNNKKKPLIKTDSTHKR